MKNYLAYTLFLWYAQIKMPPRKQVRHIRRSGARRIIRKQKPPPSRQPPQPSPPVRPTSLVRIQPPVPTAPPILPIQPVRLPVIKPVNLHLPPQPAVVKVPSPQLPPQQVIANVPSPLPSPLPIAQQEMKTPPPRSPSPLQNQNSPIGYSAPEVKTMAASPLPPLPIRFAPHQVSSIYLGYDIHAYTQQVKDIAHYHQARLEKHYGTNRVDEAEFNKIMHEMERTYGHKVAFQNIRNLYRDGVISDPHVPGLNSALVLRALWDKVKEINEYSTYNHFNETLDQISSTCIQGVTHRLFIDYVCIVE